MKSGESLFITSSVREAQQLLFLFLFFFLTFGRANFRAVFARKGRGGDAHYCQSSCASLHPTLFACCDVVVQVGNVREFGTFSSPSTVYRDTRATNFPRNPVVNTTKIYFIYLCHTFFQHTRRACYTVINFLRTKVIL